MKGSKAFSKIYKRKIKIPKCTVLPRDHIATMDTQMTGQLLWDVPHSVCRFKGQSFSLRKASSKKYFITGLLRGSSAHEAVVGGSPLGISCPLRMFWTWFAFIFCFECFLMYWVRTSWRSQAPVGDQQGDLWGSLAFSHWEAAMGLRGFMDICPGSYRVQGWFSCR